MRWAGEDDTDPFGLDRPMLLYYLRVEVRGRAAPLYKIGFTRHSVRRRYRAETAVAWRVLRVWAFANAAAAKAEERRIKREHADDRYTGAPVFLHVGTGELFVRDVLSLDPHAGQELQGSLL